VGVDWYRRGASGRLEVCGGAGRSATVVTEDTEKPQQDELTERIVAGAMILEIKAVLKLRESPKSPPRGDCLFHFSESRLVDGITRISP
jgi:hypothetical protein